LPEELRRISNEALLGQLGKKLKVVYGVDDRQDIREWIKLQRAAVDRAGASGLHDGILRNAQRVCCIVNKMKVHAIPGADAYQVDVSKFDVCPEERFSGQPVMSYCSGFLAGKDLIVSAGHCFKEHDARDQAYIFGYQLPTEGMLRDKGQFVIPSENVYFARELVKGRLDLRTGLDFAIVRLDREVVGRSPVQISSRPVVKGDRVYTIGHPCGLPMKVANNAVVLSSRDVFFVTNLDTYGGNSGSGVWLEDTHELVGILVRGGDDFEFVSVPERGGGGTPCRRTVYVGDSEGGEGVTKVSEFLPALRASSGE
jgi:hypothetical protein